VAVLPPLAAMEGQPVIPATPAWYRGAYEDGWKLVRRGAERESQDLGPNKEKDRNTAVPPGQCDTAPRPAATGKRNQRRAVSLAWWPGHSGSESSYGQWHLGTLNHEALLSYPRLGGRWARWRAGKRRRALLSPSLGAHL
jgi:hypothetical protein